MGRERADGSLLDGAGRDEVSADAAAVANAVYNATGNRVRDLPLTLDKLS